MLNITYVHTWRHCSKCRILYTCVHYQCWSGCSRVYTTLHICLCTLSCPLYMTCCCRSHRWSSLGVDTWPLQHKIQAVWLFSVLTIQLEDIMFAIIHISVCRSSSVHPHWTSLELCNTSIMAILQPNVGSGQRRNRKRRYLLVLQTRNNG